MKEILLTNKKHGMAVLLLTILLYIIAVVGLIFSATEEVIPGMVVCIVYLSLGWWYASFTCPWAGWSCRD